MKWMALGEVGAYLLGLSSAVAASMFLENVEGFWKILVFVMTLWYATKAALWFVHLGFDGKVSDHP